MGTEHVTRRQFLGAVTSGIVLATAGSIAREASKEYEKSKEYDRTHDFDRIFKTYFEKDNPALTFESACDISLRFDKLFDSFPPYDYHPTVEDIQNWVVEIYPMFAYNGIAPRIEPPENVGVAIYRDPRRHNHILGQSNCTDSALLNYRMFNPVSAWYDNPGFLPTLTHELAHTLQGDLCDRGSIVENSAQIATLEVLASLANRKNDLVLIPLIDELSSVFIGAAYSIALAENRMNEFNEFSDKINSKASERASFFASARKWKNDLWELKRILKTYQETPARMIINARFNDGEVEPLAFPPIYSPNFNGYGTSTPEKIYIDDLLYFISNAEALVSENIQEIPKNEQ